MLGGNIKFDLNRRTNFVYFIMKISADSFFTLTTKLKSISVV